MAHLSGRSTTFVMLWLAIGVGGCWLTAVLGAPYSHSGFEQAFAQVGAARKLSQAEGNQALLESSLQEVTGGAKATHKSRSYRTNGARRLHQQGTGSSNDFNHSIIPWAPDEFLPLPVVSAGPGQPLKGLKTLQQGGDNRANQALGLPPRFPLDMALCRGPRHLLQVINSAMVVLHPNGTQQGVYNLYNLAGGGPGNGSDSRITDPRCLFDSDYQRFIVVAAWFKKDGPAPARFSRLLILVSRGPDPTSDWTPLVLSADGSKKGGGWIGSEQADGSSASCPCFADYPTLGGDSHSVIISMNLMAQDVADTFVTAQLMLLDKAALMTARAGQPLPFLRSTNFQWGGFELATLQPAQLQAGSPSGGAASPRFNGVHYVMAASPFPMTGLVLIAVSGVGNISGDPQGIQISQAMVPFRSPWYPPFGQHSTASGEGFQWKEIQLEQVSLAAGLLYTAVSTGGVVGGQRRDGCMAFVVEPFLSGAADSPSLAGAMLRSPVVMMQDLDAYFPAIAVDPLGRGVVAFSVMDDRGRAGVAYTGISPFGQTGKVFLLVPPQAPYQGSRARWGDYFAATYDGFENATYIGMTYASAEVTNYTSSGVVDNARVAVALVDNAPLLAQIPYYKNLGKPSRPPPKQRKSNKPPARS